MTDLSGKLILVSGGARDIGRSIVVALARHGARVAFTHHATAPTATLDAVRAAGGTAWAAPLDALDISAPAKFVAAAQAHYGNAPVYGVVNNSGGLVARKRIEEIDAAFWDHVQALNARSAFVFTQAAVAAMAAEQPGAVVTIASQAGRDGGGAGAGAYAASKGALMAWSRNLAKELGPRNIRVNAVCPGLINTTFHDVFTKPENRKAAAGMTPLRREGSPDEVADLVAFLLSSSSSFVNGACYDINGGLAFS